LKRKKSGTQYSGLLSAFEVGIENLAERTGKPGGDADSLASGKKFKAKKEGRLY